MKHCPYHDDCRNEGTVEIVHGGGAQKVCEDHLPIYLTNGWEKTAAQKIADDLVVREAKRLSERGSLLARIEAARYQQPVVAMREQTVNERFAALVSRAQRSGIRLTLVATPDPTMLREFKSVGNPFDLQSQLDIAEAYLIGLEWRDVPRG